MSTYQVPFSSNMLTIFCIAGWSLSQVCSNLFTERGRFSLPVSSRNGWFLVVHVRDLVIAAGESSSDNNLGYEVAES